MIWFLLPLFYVLLLSLPVAVVACAGRSSSPPVRTVRATWKPIACSGSTSRDEELQVSRLHVIVLVHGWLGNPSEMGYLKQSLYRSVSRIHAPRSECHVVSSSTQDILSNNPIAVKIFSKDQTDACAFVIHSAECNSGPALSSDGIEAGGKRLAAEVDTLISYYVSQCSEKALKEITLSMVGNSLGGLYARYAISQMDALTIKRGTTGATFSPKFFVTTCTPHLGVSQNTFIKIPTWLEASIARVMQQTGLDLFRRSGVIQDMTVNSTFLQPLLSFTRRIALANVYGTDFQVPTPTAAFWANTDSIHQVVCLEEAEMDSSHNIILQLQTQQTKDTSHHSNRDHRLSDDQLSTLLDQIGWTKILVDVRRHMPITGRMVGTTMPDTASPLLKKSTWTARELLQEFNTGHFHHVPLGHTVTVANSKDRLNTYLTKGGKATMDYIADKIVRGLEAP